MNKEVIVKGEVFFIVVLAVTLGYTQAPDTLWSGTYGGSANDHSHMCKETSDGGYIIAGETNSYGAGEYDAYIVKLDANGDFEWDATYGTAGVHEHAQDIHETADGGYIWFGLLNTGPTGRDYWLVKIDSLGQVLWDSTYGLPDGPYVGDDGNMMDITSDGGYALFGNTDSHGAGGVDAWLVRTDSLGHTLWTMTYGGATTHELALAGQETSDKGFIMGGIYATSTSYDDFDVLLIKTDSLGDTLWTKTYGGPGYDDCYGVQQTIDGGYILAGQTVSGSGNGDVWLLKTFTNGDTAWTRTYGTAQMDWGTTVQQTSDSGFIIAATYGLNGRDAWLIKTDTLGDIMWTALYGGAGEEWGWSVQQTSDDGYVVAGRSNSFGNAFQCYVIRTEPDTLVDIEENGSSVASVKEITQTIFRGPLQLPEDKVCKIFDITGRIVEPARIAPGVYFVEIDNKVVQKVVKIR